ncbi:MAG TPA: ribosome maturation factor RimM [Jatrophihabitantaceae bacterium]
MADDELLVVGRVGPPHGVRGAVIVQPFTDDPDERFADGSVLATTADPLTVQAARWHGNRLVVQFDGVADRSAAERLRGVELLLAASDRPPLDDPDDFYDTDLVGLTASTVDGRPLGPVRDVVHAPASDYLVVEVDGRDRLVPFVAAVVPTVDVAGGRVVIDPPEGLLEL